MEIEVVDNLEQRVLTDDISVVKISTSSEGASIQGIFTAQVSKGLAIFEDFFVTSDPD